MKKIFFATLWVALATALPNLVKAQAPDTSTIEKLQRYVASPLNKNQVPTGFLEDYGAPFIPMAAFNGNLSDSNIIEMNLWRLLYFQLQTSYCQAGTNPLPSIVDVNADLKAATTNAIPISLLLGQYAKIKEDAYNNNLLYFNNADNKVYDVENRTESPYNINYLFAAAPLQTNNFTNTASFVYNPSFVWANTGLTISQLQVNFDDGLGLRTLTPNVPVTVTYTDSGFHQLTIKATLSNSHIVQCYSNYYVLTLSNNGGTGARYTAPNIVNPSWGTIAPLAGVHGGGTISYILSSSNAVEQIKKPLIVAENMDIFGIAPKLQERPYSIENLLKAIKDPEDAGFDFNDALDVAEYDLIFINFNNGADGVIANSKVFNEAIALINANKWGEQQNVILGIGTGGLIARYALADITKTVTGNPTQTRLLITHDAPHKGANIALGIQMMTRMLANYNYLGITTREIFPEYDETLKLYDAPISQDILFYRSVSDENFTSNSFINNVYQPMVSYNSPYKFVATSLGNECANQLLTAGNKFIDYGADVYAKLKAKAFWGLVSVTLVKVNYETRIYARAVPQQNDSNREIAQVSCIFKLKLFGALTLAKTGYDQVVNVGSNIIPYDGVPGSNQQILNFGSLRNYYDALAYLQDPSRVGTTLLQVAQYLQAIDKAIKALKDIKSLADLIGSANFFGLGLGVGVNAYAEVFETKYTSVPVGSALDVNPFTTNTFTEKYVNDVNINYPSVAETFIAQESNYSQSLFNNASMRFTARNARFIFKVIEGLTNNENCSAECVNPYYIKGDVWVCNTTEYKVKGLSANATVVWSANPSGLVSLTTIGNDVIVTKLNDGFVTLTAVVTNSCSNGTYTKKIISGRAKPDNFIVSGYSYQIVPQTRVINGGMYVYFQMHPELYPAGTIFNYYVFNDLVASIPSPSFGFSPTYGYDMDYEISVTVETPCGTSDPVGEYFYWQSWQGGRLAVSPNPAKGVINVTVDDLPKGSEKNKTKDANQQQNTINKTTPSGRTFIYLIDMNTSKIVKQWSFNEINSIKYQLNTEGLRHGVYVLQVNRKGKLLTTKVFIE